MNVQGIVDQKGSKILWDIVQMRYVQAWKKKDKNNFSVIIYMILKRNSPEIRFKWMELQYVTMVIDRIVQSVSAEPDL